MNRHKLYWSVMGIEENTEMSEEEKDKNILIAMIERNNNKPFRS